MGKTYDENGEEMAFVGREQTTIRGTVQTDGMGREWIDTGEGGGNLTALLPDGVGVENINNDESEADEYRFMITVDVDQPTGEFRDE